MKAVKYYYQFMTKQEIESYNRSFQKTKLTKKREQYNKKPDTEVKTILRKKSPELPR